MLAVSGNRAVLQPLKGSQSEVVLRGGSEHIRAATLSPDGGSAVTRSERGARIWNAATGRAKPLGRGARAVAFSFDGKRTLIGHGSNAEVQTRGERKPLVLKTQAKTVDAAAFSADGQLIAVAGSDGITIIFSKDGRRLASLISHTRPIESVRFNADGTRVITANGNGTAVVWTTSGRIVRILNGHSAGVLAAVFSSDVPGRLVLTTSADGTARVWNLNRGVACAVFGDRTTPIRAAEFDGAERIITVNTEGIVRKDGLGLCAQDVDDKLLVVAKQVVQPLTDRERSALLRNP